MKKGKFVKATAVLMAMLMVGALMLLAGCGSSQPAKPAKDFILIGRVNPTTGPLAQFGAGTPFVEEKAIEAINKDGGIFIAEYNKKIPLKLIVADSESNPTKAAEAANKLVLQDKVDLLVVEHTPDTVNPVAAAAERHKIPCISLDAPIDSWTAGGEAHYWSFHAFWTIGSYDDVYLDMFDLMPTNKKVGFLFGNDTDGVVISKDLAERAKARGYTVYDPGRFPADTKDFTSLINQFKQQGIEIVVANLIPPDFANFWKQAHQQGFVPKVMGIGKAALFANDVAAIGGDLGVGLITEVWWTPQFPFKSSLTGQNGADIAKMWIDSQKTQPNATLGYKHASMEIVVDVLKRAQSLDREKIRTAIKATNIDTMVGHIQYNDKNYAETMLAGGQWVKGKTWPWELNIISNKKVPLVPLSAEKMFPVPDSK